MLAITDKSKFDYIVSDAISKAINNCDAKTAQRWINAIGKAVEMLETQGEFMTYDTEGNYLVVWSQKSDKVYSANGTCQCIAFTEYHAPCWHRALARLIRLYLGNEENARPNFPNDSEAVSCANITPSPSSFSGLQIVEAYVPGAAMGGQRHRVEKAVIGNMRIQL